MADPWHVKWLEEGVVKWNKRRKKVKFSPDLSGLRFFDLLPLDFRDDPKTSRYFEKIDLSSADLSGSDLSDLNFSRSRFDNANLENANLSKSNFSRASFVNSNLSNIEVKNATFQQAVFDNVTLENSSFEGVEAGGALFISSPLSPEQIESLAVQSQNIFKSKPEYKASIAISQNTPPSVNQMVMNSGKLPDDDRTRKNKYDVFYGTNRQPIMERGTLIGFNDAVNSEISYGVCEVIVPESHKIGSIGSPLWKRLLNRKDDRLRIDGLISLNQQLFFKHIQNIIRRMKVPAKPTIFIHGFNNTFDDAVLQAAQIGYDLGVGQGMGLFSWPSKGRLLKYSADEASSDASKYQLAEFIKGFVRNTNEGGINVIAHSMGCRCLLGALEVLSKTDLEVLQKIEQVIFAAADVDAAIMPYLAPHAVNNCTRTTSYVSDLDKALVISTWLHDFQRIGVMPPAYVLTGMDTILVNGLDLGNFSHTYVSSSRTILNDMHYLLKNGLAPSERHSLELVRDTTPNYWRIKE